MAKEKIENPTLQSRMDELNKKFGKGTVISLNGGVTGEYDVIPSGSIGIDYRVMGIGGFARGKLYECRGWSSAGKSSLSGHLVAGAQKTYPNHTVLYIDSEHAVDKWYFQQLGVNIDKLIICQPDYGEEGFEVALKLIETGEISLCIFDSDSGLIPKSVMEGEVGAANVGKKAKLNSEVYVKIKLALSKYNTCGLAISQYRQQIGMMFGDPKITQGGKSLEFYADCVFEMTKKLKKEDDETSGNITTIKTIKNKLFPPYKSHTLDLLFGVGYDKIGEIFEMATDLEIIKKWGQSVTYKETKYNLDDFMVLLSDNPEFFQEIKSQVLEKLKSND